MTSRSEADLVKRLKAFVSIATVFSMLLGLSGLAGWALNLPALVTWGDGAAMAPNAAACFLLAGLSLFLRREKDKRPFTQVRKLTAQVSAALVALAGSLALVEQMSGRHLGIDRLLLLRSPGPPIAADRIVMSPVAAGAFLLLSLALLLIDWRPRREKWPAQFICLAAALTPVFGVLGWILGPGAPPITLAWPGLVAFALLAAALLCSRAPWAMGGVLTRQRPGARLLRGAFPAVLLALCVLGWLLSKPLLSGVHFTWAEVTVLAIVTGGMIACFIGWTTFIVDRSDRERKRLEGALQLSQDQLDRLLNAVDEPQTEARLRTLVKAGVAVAVLLTGLLGALSWHTAQQAAHDADWVAHAHEVFATLELTLRHLIDVEIGARGFALTGHEPLLEPYDSGKNAVILDLQELRGLVVEPDQVTRLDLLVKRANIGIEDSEDLVAARRQSGQIPAMTRLIQGKQAMDAVRSTVQQMEDQEKLLLEQRTQRAQRAQHLTSSAIALGSVLGIIFLSIAGITVSREIRVAAHAQGQVKILNADLERRVKQRTAALEAEAAARLESEGRLAAVIKWATDSIIMVDDQQHIALFNQAAEKMFLCPRNTALGQPITAFIPHLGRFGENDAAHRANGLHGELWAVRADGEKFQIEASISENELAGHQMFTIILRDVTERKQAEQMRERLAAIVDSSDDAIISRTLDGTISAWNRGAENLFGYPASEALGKTISMLLPAERAGEEADMLVRVLDGESVKHFETVRVRKDGTNLDVSLTISPIRDGDGLIVGASKIARDISERKRAEEALRGTDTRRKSALEMAKLGDWELDLTTMQATRSLLHDQIFGHPSLLPEWNFDIFLAHVHADDREAVRESFQNALSLEKRWEFECRIVWENGAVRWIWGCGNQYLDSAGKAARMFGIVQDVTERREALDALRESEERFQAMANGIPQLAWIAAADGSHYWYNQRWYEFTGTTPEEMHGWGWHSVHHRDFLPKVLARWTSAIAKGEPFEMEFPLRGTDGLFRAFLTRVMPLKDSGGRVVRWFGTNTDISGLKRSEERLAVQAEEIRKLNEDLEEKIAKRTEQLAAANQELEAFSYSVSHDLRAPLRHIFGFSRILIAEFAPGMATEAREHLERIQTAVVRMGLLVDGLLGLARLGRQSLKLCSTDLNDVVDEVISILEPECEARQVEWHIASLPALDCDPILIAQVFQNLLGNALKYSRGRARAVIEVDSIQHPGKPAIIFVRDNGVGFNMRYTERLFGVFRRLHTDSEFEGTGVGLATVQRIIQKHGGMIWAEAEVDHGATFYFALQRTEEIETAAKAAAVLRPAL